MKNFSFIAVLIIKRWQWQLSEWKRKKEAEQLQCKLVTFQLLLEMRMAEYSANQFLSGAIAGGFWHFSNIQNLVILIKTCISQINLVFCRKEYGTLGLFLQSQAKEMDPEWSCIASVELIIKSNKTDVNDFSAKYSHHFSQIEDECGYPRFKTLKVREK